MVVFDTKVNSASGTSIEMTVDLYTGNSVQMS